MVHESKIGINDSEDDNDERLQVSSKGKRLFSLLLDFIFALLFSNTITQLFRREHWDLGLSSAGFLDFLPFYGSMIFVLLFKDYFGRSPGKFLLGMSTRIIYNFSLRPSRFALLGRNIFLLIFPVEGVILLKDVYARRLADRLFKTVVLEDKKTLRPILRILLGNIILFGFFSMAILFQRSSIEKTAAFQKATEAIRNHASLRILLDRYPEIEEAEMHLDLRGKIKNPSIVSVRVGGEESGKLVTVLLLLRKNPKSWEVLNIEVKPINVEKID